MTVRTRRKRIICFIDDDPNELTRFVRAVEPRFDVIAGTSCTACQRELARRKLAEPDLRVLDLYFPKEENAPNSPAELTAIGERR
jgi:ActR/RegA family two-component response regulator